MYDLHCHILPTFDDGSDSMEESCAMAELAYQSKVKGIVATPHCNGEDLLNAERNVMIGKTLDLLREKLKLMDIPIKLYSGMEILLDDGVYPALEQGKMVTVNGSNYALVEFPFDDDERHVLELLSNVASRGYRLIIAHPERYEFVHNNPELIFTFLDNDYVLQLNRGSILGRFGERIRECAKWMLTGQLAHIVASDGHSSLRRTPYMFDCYQHIRKHYSAEYAEILFYENPSRILKNEPILPNC
ncbi:MAG: hypothetical protein Q4C01_07755 [Clostridia bacterium]|nr:hypothetical protein [Clostridia bacterium]